MLPETVIRRLEAIGEISKQGKRLNGLFRLMENPILWYEAYANIYSNEGAMTKGVDNSTLDGFSKERVNSIIKRLKEGKYHFKPTRRVYVPKKNGKKRPLGISSGDDKLVQEVVRNILERIYEPTFSDQSHGFRPGRSPHTALRRIEQEWTAVKWIVDMDIQSYFDTIPHEMLVTLLEKKIEDKRFIKLIQAMLDAGYLEDWKYHATYSGVPQGSIVSPILANIYLHELDLFMQKKKNSLTKEIGAKETKRTEATPTKFIAEDQNGIDSKERGKTRKHSKRSNERSKPSNKSADTSQVETLLMKDTRGFITVDTLMTTLLELLAQKLMRKRYSEMSSNLFKRHSCLALQKKSLIFDTVNKEPPFWDTG